MGGDAVHRRPAADRQHRPRRARAAVAVRRRRPDQSRDAGADLILHVVCDKDNQLKRGEKALILGYDAARDAYEVEPVDWLLPEELEHLKDPLTAATLARDKARTR